MVYMYIKVKNVNFHKGLVKILLFTKKQYVQHILYGNIDMLKHMIVK